jgi:phenylacetate-CoA ligase
VFNAPVFNSYGSREVQAHAFECPTHTGLHVIAPTVYFEILRKDGGDVMPGEVGEVVMTPFFNYAMPLIRYRIGDMASWAEKPCSCGRKWPLLKDISGRKIECFIRKDGGIVPPEYFSRIFGVTLIGDWIDKFQIVQENLELIDVFIVRSRACGDQYKNHKESIDQIKTKIRHVMSDKCTVNFKFVNDIPPLKSGKYLNTISKI